MRLKIALVSVCLLFVFSVLVSAKEPPRLKVPKVDNVPSLVCVNGVCFEDAAPAARPKRVKWFPRFRNLCSRLKARRSIKLFPNAWWNK